jgi:hypothetical protein
MKRFVFPITTVLVLTGILMAQEAKPNLAELAAATTVATCSSPANDPAIAHECEKRDTARLFLIMGKPEAALRILCNTRPAIEVFRPNGALGSDKYEDNVAGNKACLQAVGIDTKEK